MSCVHQCTRTLGINKGAMIYEMMKRQIFPAAWRIRFNNYNFEQIRKYNQIKGEQKFHRENKLKKKLASTCFARFMSFRRSIQIPFVFRGAALGVTVCYVWM